MAGSTVPIAVQTVPIAVTTPILPVQSVCTDQPKMGVGESKSPLFCFFMQTAGCGQGAGHRNAPYGLCQNPVKVKKSKISRIRTLNRLWAVNKALDICIYIQGVFLMPRQAKVPAEPYCSLGSWRYRRKVPGLLRILTFRPLHVENPAEP